MHVSSLFVSAVVVCNACILVAAGEAGTTPWDSLHAAAAKGETERVTKLLAEGAPVQGGAAGVTALHHAAEKGHTATALKLVALGADVHAVSVMHVWRTPAEVASLRGHHATATHLALLQFGASRKQLPYIIDALPEPLDRNSLALLDRTTLVAVGLGPVQARRILQHLTAWLSPWRALAHRAWYGYVLPHDPDKCGAW